MVIWKGFGILVPVQMFAVWLNADHDGTRAMIPGADKWPADHTLFFVSYQHWAWIGLSIITIAQIMP